MTKTGAMRVRRVASVLLMCAVGSRKLTGQSTLVIDSVSSPGLHTNVVGGSPIRQVLVYLPPSYRREQTLDSLIAASIPEFIVVMPDADNALGADWYTNSPVTGNWQDFAVRDLVGHIDQHYRTRATSRRRALVGHSMGGFGALAISFEHPSVVGLAYAISPCCIGFSGRLAPSAPTWPVETRFTKGMLPDVGRWFDSRRER